MSHAVTEELETGIPALDSCLSRHDPDGLRWGDIIHIHGPSGSGKSLLVYLLVVTCCMPLNRLSDFPGGWNKIAFVFDMDGTLDILQFHQFLLARLAKIVPSVSVDPVLSECLKRVHIFRPHSTEELAVTLAHLPKYHSNNFPDAGMGMIVIHSFEAFHWLDQFKAEQLKSLAPSGRSTMLQNILNKLDDLRRSYDAIGIVSHWGLPGIQNVFTSSDTLQVDIHINPLQRFRTFHFHLAADLNSSKDTAIKTAEDTLGGTPGIFHLSADWFNRS